jgi:Tfp pilus assembly protein PilV
MTPTLRIDSRARGLSLVEVVAALLILGGAITVMLVAQSRALMALKSSHLELTALHLAKDLIATWDIEKPGAVRSASGTFPKEEGWSWRRSSRPLADEDMSGMVEITLELCFSGIESQEKSRCMEYVWLARTAGK